MAKKSKIARNLQRQATVDHFAQQRARLKSQSTDPHVSEEDRAHARLQLHQLPRDASPTRVRNRGVSDGRPRGYLRKFGLSRTQFRDKALGGELPGVTKSSW